MGFDKKLLSKEGMNLLWKHKGYLPTALKAWKLIQNTDFKPVSNSINSNIHADDPFSDPAEKDDLIKRAEWLCKEVIVDNPDKLIDKMPKAIGRMYQGEWAIYACSMTAVALCNLIRIYPDSFDKFIGKIPLLIDLVNTPSLRYYDTITWKEDAMETIDGNRSHMTYISILAWMIGQYRLAGGNNQYDHLHKKLCETLNRRMLLSSDLNLPSFPNGMIYFPDMMFSILALKDYSKLNNGEFDEIVSQWLEKAKHQWIDSKTGLLQSTLSRKRIPGRLSGAYSGLNTTCLCMLDKDFGRDQYERLLGRFGVSLKETNHTDLWGYGINEYLNRSPKVSFDIDAGPIIYGLSPTGIAFTLGASTILEDWEFRKGLLATAEVAGKTVKYRHTHHYKLSEIFLTGEAITLAMRTMRDF